MAPQIIPRSLDELFQLPEMDWRCVPVHSLVDFAAEVRSTRAEKLRRASGVLDAASGRELTRSQQADHDRYVAEVDTCSDRLEHLSIAIDEARSRLTTQDPGVPSWGVGDRGPEADAFRSYFRTGDEAELRAQSVGTGSAGGYFVPQGFRTTVVDSMKAFGGIRRLAEIIPSDDGAPLPFPTNDDTSNVGVILAENTQMTEQDASLGTKTLGAYTFSSKLVRVSMQLLQDSAFDLDSWLARKLGQRIGRGQAVYWATGTGTSQPQGLVTGVSNGVTAASTTAITGDELLTLQHSVDPAYREGTEVGTAAPGTAWVMNDTTFALIRKLKDADGQYLVQSDNQAGGFTRLFGYPVAIDQAMPAPTTGLSPIVFGNIRAAYVIRDVKQVEVLRLVERYADYLQVGFTAWHRADGLVQDAAAAKKLTMA